MSDPPVSDLGVSDEGVDDPPRTIAFEAVFNFRDLGGYPARRGQRVRWRRLFRADGLNRVRTHEADVVRRLGIRTVVDLRTNDEVRTHGRFPDEVAEVNYCHLPVFDVQPDWAGFDEPDAPGFLADRYVEMLESGRPSVAAALKLLADPGAYPLVFHCAAGKDRTGILASVVLALLGVPDDVIVEDYALSHQATERMFAWVAARGRDLDSGYQTPPPSVLAAHPDTMVRFLEHLDATHGGASGLVQDLGVGTDTIDRIRENLLEPA